MFESRHSDHSPPAFGLAHTCFACSSQVSQQSQSQVPDRIGRLFPRPLRVGPAGARSALRPAASIRSVGWFRPVFAGAARTSQNELAHVPYALFADSSQKCGKSATIIKHISFTRGSPVALLIKLMQCSFQTRATRDCPGGVRVWRASPRSFESGGERPQWREMGRASLLGGGLGVKRLARLASSTKHARTNHNRREAATNLSAKLRYSCHAF